jgi:hypothetical protein
MLRRRTYVTLIAALLVCAFLAGVGAPPPAQALPLIGDLGVLVKVFGIGWVVERFAPKINTAINSALKQHDAEISGYTKVVPIIRVGGKTEVGAAQVMGPREQVDKVQAVAEVQLNIIGSVRSRGLIPISTKNAATVRGVDGVGVSANIKFPL